MFKDSGVITRAAREEKGSQAFLIAHRPRPWWRTVWPALTPSSGSSPAGVWCPVGTAAASRRGGHGEEVRSAYARATAIRHGASVASAQEVAPRESVRGGDHRKEACPKLAPRARTTPSGPRGPAPAPWPRDARCYGTAAVASHEILSKECGCKGITDYLI